MKRTVEQILVTDPLGIHARPASALAVAIGKSGARVKLRLGERSADAKSVIQMMALGATAQSVLTAEIEGDEDATASALDALHAFLKGYEST